MPGIISSMINRIYVQQNHDYPMGESLDKKSIFIDVLENYMGDMFQDGMVYHAVEIENKLKEYKHQLQREIAAMNSHPDNKVSRYRNEDERSEQTDSSTHRI